MSEFKSLGRLTFDLCQDIAKCEELRTYLIASVICGTYDVKCSGSVLPHDSLFALNISCLEISRSIQNMNY